MLADRRSFLAGTAATALVAACPARGQAPAAAVAPADAALRAELDRLADALLANAPEQVTSLGLDKGARAAAKARLTSRSAATLAANARIVRDGAARLARFDRAALSPPQRIALDSARAALRLGVDGQRFAFGENSFAAAMAENMRPYVVSQSNGAALEVPEFLDSQHAIATRADADAYLARLGQLGRVMDEETARTLADTARGIVAPDFVLDNVLGQLRAMRAEPPAQQKLVRSLADRTRAKAIAGDWSARAERLVATGVIPALDRQIAALETARARATHDAGVWTLKDGAAYYAWALDVGTTTRLTADEIHRIGLDQDRELESAMDAILKTQGLVQGSVADRTQALAKDPRYLYPDSDAGRAALLAYLNQLVADTRPRLARISKLGLAAPVSVRRVPPDIQNGAPQGYMMPGALDGSRPSIYYINLKSMANWPRWQLPTLTAHETVPGHAWQFDYLAAHRDTLPLWNSLTAFNGFVEGWALYAEQLNDELGAYADDPLGRLGYLQAQRFRAGRLVVDTGLHARRWSREQAVDWLMAATGRARDGVTSEVDRYCVWPGQACGYKVGHNEIVRLRARAQRALGGRFDLRDFNDAVVATTGVPLTVLETAVDAYVAGVGA